MQHTINRTAALTTALVAALSVGLMMPSQAQAAVPVITSFSCPQDNGGGRFYCDIEYTSDSAATVQWVGTGTRFNGPGYSFFYGRCIIGSLTNITVKVSNASGTTTMSSGSFICRGGPIII